MGFWPHPDYLVRHLTSRQIAEWMAFQEIEPFGERPAWARMGILAATVANSFRDRKRSRLATPEDFMPEWEWEKAQPRKQTPEEQKRVLMRWFDRMEKQGKAKRVKRGGGQAHGG